MRKKRFSIFDFDHEYIPFSVWDTGSGNLSEVNEDPEPKAKEPGNGMWSGAYLPKKGNENIQPTKWFNDHPNAPSTGSILFTDKKGTQPNNFPRRNNNTLKTVHQQIVNRNNLSSEQKAETPVIGIPSYGMVGKRVGSEALRYVEEMASPPKSVYDLDKIDTHISTASPYPYINAPGMTNEEIDVFLQNMTPSQKDSIEKVYKQYTENARRDGQTLTGEKIKPVKAVVFDPYAKSRAPIQYKNDTITIKRGFLERSENMKRSLLIHETQHHADKDKLPIRRMTGQNGEEIYNEETSYSGIPFFKAPERVYTNEEIQKEKGLQIQEDIVQRLMRYNESTAEDKFIYYPSNFIQAEINAINAQLEAYSRGLIPLSEQDLSDIQLNLRTRQAGLRKALNYEKEKGYAPTGYPLEK